jgi:hypothetical protein
MRTMQMTLNTVQPHVKGTYIVSVLDLPRKAVYAVLPRVYEALYRYIVLRLGLAKDAVFLYTLFAYKVRHQKTF